MNLDEACTAAWKRARERCMACQAAAFPADCNCTICRQTGGEFEPLPHTCYGDIEAVKAVALAAVDVAAGRYRTVGRVKALAELDRLLEVKHD